MNPVRNHVRPYVYLAGFFLTLHLALPIYLGSSFLSQYLNKSFVGAVYIIGSLLSLFALTQLPGVLRRTGLQKTTVWLIFCDITVLLAIVLFKLPVIAIAAFIIFNLLTIVLRFNLDLFLEEVSNDRTTGEIRGLFLTLNNVAWILSPLIAGLVAQTAGYGRVYFLSLLVLLPLLYLQIRHLEDPPTVQRPQFRLWPELLRLWEGRRVNIFKILSLDLLLNFFYAVMVVYTPIYLHEYIGLGWPQIGVIFTVMLLPFLLLQWPLGRLADRLLGEKEILTAGLIIMSAATLFIPWLTTQKIWLWALLLFSTRVGAASVEIMKETYLFKQISGADSAILSLSRSTFPLAYVLAPLFVTIFFIFFPFRHIFTALGLLLLLGLPYSLTLKDTK